MRKRTFWIATVLVMASLFLWGQSASALIKRPPKAPPNAPLQVLGDHIFHDVNLSDPPGVSCETCHAPQIFWADPRRTPTSAGNLGVSGDRNSPQMSYSAFSPYFHRDPKLGYVGGQFWDGRAKDLVQQAKGPFLNPIEMNATKAYVVQQVKNSAYATLFKEVFGPGAFRNVSTAYNNIAQAVAAYVQQSEFFNFNSKYDYYLAGMVQLTGIEQKGLNLFNGKGKCATCHPTTATGPAGPPMAGGPPDIPLVLFTHFTYENLGLPANKPVAAPTPDLGLGAVVKDPLQDGKFKVPTLRNIQFTWPYGHNGLFRTLEEMIRFINTRDIMTPNNVPEVNRNVNTEVGNLGLTDPEIKAIIAFLKTLTDGYVFDSPIVIQSETDPGPILD